MITPKNVLKHELIGLKVRVDKSKNKNLIGLTGEVVDETRNMLILGDGRKLIKENITIEMNGTVLDGKGIIGRPENRIKR